MSNLEKENEELQNSILTLIDEDDSQHHFELIDEVEHNEERYIATVPYYEDEEEAMKQEPVLIIFRVGEVDEEGLETYDIVDDDEEYLEVGAIFSKRLQDIFDIEQE